MQGKTPNLKPANLAAWAVWRLVDDQLIIAPSGHIVAVNISAIDTACKMLSINKERHPEVVEKIKVIKQVFYEQRQ